MLENTETCGLSYVHMEKHSSSLPIDLGNTHFVLWTLWWWNSMNKGKYSETTLAAVLNSGTATWALIEWNKNLCNNIYRSIKESEFIPSFLHNMKSWNWQAVSKQGRCARFIDNFIRYDKGFLCRYLFSKFLILLRHSTEVGILLKNPAICDSKESIVRAVTAEEMKSRSENKSSHLSAVAIGKSLSSSRRNEEWEWNQCLLASFCMIVGKTLHDYHFAAFFTQHCFQSSANWVSIPLPSQSLGRTHAFWHKVSNTLTYLTVAK